MDAGKTAVSGLIIMLCFNLAIWYVNERSIPPRRAIDVPLDPEQIMQDFNATNVALGYQAIDLSFLSNVVTAMQMFGRLIGCLIAGIPAFLMMLGCPWEIAILISVPYSIVWIIALAEIVRGLRISQ